jgi:hypothetical protein
MTGEAVRIVSIDKPEAGKGGKIRFVLNEADFRKISDAVGARPVRA